MGAVDHAMDSLGLAAEVDDATEALLDAARTCVLAVGVRRTTLVDVARRAGVSRMTVYRRFGDVTTLVAELLTRELAAVLRASDAATAVAGDRHARGRLVAAVVHGAAELERHPLWRKVVDVDPEALLPYVVDRLGGTQRVALATFRRLVHEGQADGSVRDGDPDVLAVAVLLAGQGSVMSARVAGAVLTDEQRSLALRLTLDGLLRPAPGPTPEPGAGAS